MCLSTWADAVVSNSLIASRRGKQVWSLLIALWNKISNASTERHQSIFGNKLMTALVTLKTMADQQSAWGSSLKGIQVVVQCTIQYTENSPGCSTAKYTMLEAGGKYTTQCWKPLLARWTVTDLIDNVTGHIGTDYSTPFMANQSLSESKQLLTYIECSSIFPSQETGTDTLSLSHAKF